MTEGGIHGREACMAGGGVCCRRDSHCSGRYASYWNAFMFSSDEASKILILFMSRGEIDETTIYFP